LNAAADRSKLLSENTAQRFDAIVIGAGAAGLMCAIEAGKRGRRVALIDHAERVGKKILISGGGRCNFTNRHCKAENFISANPHFAKSALARYTPADFLALVEKHGIAWHEKKLGQLFCDRSASDIVQMLIEECRAAGVTTHCSTQIDSVSHSDEFVLQTGRGEFRSAALVIASGGLSIPKMGASGFGYDIARQFGLKVVEPRPALVPFVLSAEDQHRWCGLSGVSADAVASFGRQNFAEKLLITHRGLSGPVILQISSYWKPGDPVTLDILPGFDAAALVEGIGVRRDLSALRAYLKTTLPHRLADRWIEINPPVGWSNQALEEWARQLRSWQIIPETTEGYAKAEVTAGGVDTAELSAKTMESRVHGLFFIGEVVDVTGHLGGFNFQWAWASGAAAGRAV
jgi:predicted Rossmann fold flavoprotein